MKKKTLNIPRPSSELVKSYNEQWEELEPFSVPSAALDILFTKTYPSNTDLKQILIKATALNDLFKTNIMNIWPVAKHIKSLDIDKRLCEGDATLVNDLASVDFGNDKLKNFYSFATKYCHFHQPGKFSIYDRYVANLLLHFKSVDKFYAFDAIDLRNYPKYLTILKAFQKHYGLTEFNQRQLDHYLWMAGKEYFGKPTL